MIEGAWLPTTRSPPILRRRDLFQAERGPRSGGAPLAWPGLKHFRRFPRVWNTPYPSPWAATARGADSRLLPSVAQGRAFRPEVARKMESGLGESFGGSLDNE